ncbi:universal stress protein UspA [Natribacillus halophilus]|uniref:Two-component system, OmpR family, sensor histidine kinase KdpD n=1 Tax=Natribacillus halophilus TaxID=549003 RepID=A0A1G8QMW4_9BACI|nr:universal stress protein UspA [Natribacillus halophilus]SDJ06122.1 two-component system, OmpR family, sensor histidine kinase KdpD [Natribacillus halophilus]
MPPLQTNERILVCVNYGHHGARLIKRGVNLAQQLHCPLFVLVFDALPEEEYKHDKEIDMSIFQELADDYDAELFIEKSDAHDITKVIKKTAINVNATQIMIGQRIERIWTHLIGGSVIDILLQDVSDADVHVVPKSRADEPEDWQSDRGVKGYLHQQTDGAYQLHFNASQESDYEGIFFKQLHTDFNSGIFSFYHDNKVFEVRVTKGVVTSLVDIDEDDH